MGSMDELLLEYDTSKEEKKDLVRKLISVIGDDPDRPGLQETPDRVVRSWDELFSGYDDSVEKHIKIFDSDHSDLVMLRGISYFSMCEHHMLPFFGRCSVAYIPNGEGKVLGVSKVARIVNVFSRRLQIQEVLTKQVGAAIEKSIRPKGVAVVMEGVHLCMVARGVSQSDATMLTSSMLGAFRDSTSTRAEMLSLHKGG